MPPWYDWSVKLAFVSKNVGDHMAKKASTVAKKQPARPRTKIDVAPDFIALPKASRATTTWHVHEHLEQATATTHSQDEDKLPARKAGVKRR